MTHDAERQEAMMRELVRASIEPPAPGLADRVLAEVARRADEPRGTGSSPVLGLVAVVLAAALVITLLAGSRLAHGPATPASGGASGLAYHPSDVVPIAGAAALPFGLTAAGGWVAEAAGGRTTLYRSTDGGRTWRPRLAYQGDLPSQVLVDASGTGIAVVEQRDLAAEPPRLFRTTDGGDTWRPVTLGVAAQAWGRAYFVDAMHGWVLASLGPGVASMVSTSDGGQTWTQSPPFNDRANFPGLSSVQLRVLWTSGGRGLVVPPLGAGTMPVHAFVTDDGGATFRSTFPAPPQGADVTAASAALEAGLLPDGRGTLFLEPVDSRTHGTALYAYPTADAGTTWGQPVRLDGPAPQDVPRALFALDDAHWWASTGSGGDLVTSGDGGRTVNRHLGLLPAGYTFRSIGFSSAREGWAVASTGRRTALFVSADGGAHWQPVRPPA